MLNMLGMVFENWTIKARDTRIIIQVVMKYENNTKTNWDRL
jgi:hypothetical protein